jgi:glycosyltransferase involved in cell wall biosynthesis
MRASVIVPLFNKAPYILRTLESISAQTFGDFEVLVVDDGSTDEGAEQVRSYQDQRFRLISQSNAGPGAARNRALNEAQGELVAFLDADDTWDSRYLQAGVNAFEAVSNDVATVTFGYIEEPAGISLTSMWRARGIPDGDYRVTAETSALLLHYLVSYMSPCTTLARTAIARNYGGFYEKNRCTFGEDGALWLKVLLNERVWFSLEPLAHFDRRASGLSGNYKAARPIEPFLQEPTEIERACPSQLSSLLGEFLALRASKAAAMLGFWGEWRSAQAVFSRFVKVGNVGVPYFFSGLVGCTPLAQLVPKAMVSRAR